MKIREPYAKIQAIEDLETAQRQFNSVINALKKREKMDVATKDNIKTLLKTMNRFIRVELDKELKKMKKEGSFIPMSPEKVDELVNKAIKVCDNKCNECTHKDVYPLDTPCCNCKNYNLFVSNTDSN